MIKFKEQDGKLFRMLEEPTPLTPDAEMPCIIVPIQDDSPMGRFVKQCWGHDEIFMREYTICSINADMAAKVGVAKDTPLSIHMFEIIGTHVAEGSAEWAHHMMQQGLKVKNDDSYAEYYALYGSRCYPYYKNRAGNIERFDNNLVASYNLPYNYPTGWQIYEEPKEEPQPAKEPIADCENCKHVCTNSNIDHCHMYEPKHESENIIHGHIPADIVIHIGCLSGTVKDLSYEEDGRFWFIGKKTERCPGGMYAILYEEMLDAETRELVEGLLKAQQEEE